MVRPVAEMPKLVEDDRPRIIHNRQYEEVTVRLLPGEYYVTAQNEIISTVLGSCISACIRNPATGLGGMNHFMLPTPLGPQQDSWGNAAGRATRYGSAAMEELINGILKAGGERQQLEVKLFGGGRVLAQMTDIGRRNIEFADNFLEAEDMAVSARDVGGTYARQVLYFPATGKARVRLLKKHGGDQVAMRERSYKRELEKQSVSGGVELF